MNSLNYLSPPRVQMCPEQPKILYSKFSPSVTSASSTYQNRQYQNKINDLPSTNKKTNWLPITHDFQFDDSKTDKNSFVDRLNDLVQYKFEKSNSQYPYQPIVQRIQEQRKKKPQQTIIQAKIDKKQHMQMSRTHNNANKDNNNKFTHSPRIIKANPKNKSYKQIQHQRQLKSMRNRIKDCKSVQQRKKNNSDPFAHPIYLIRSPQIGQNLNMEKQYLRILSWNKSKNTKKRKRSSFRKSNIVQQNPQIRLNKQKLQDFKYKKDQLIQTRANQTNQMYNHSHHQLVKNRQSQLPQPNFLKHPQIGEYKIVDSINENKYIQRGSKQGDKKFKNYQHFSVNAKVFSSDTERVNIGLSKNFAAFSHPLNLPGLDQTEILKHIIEHNIYKAQDLKIMHSRYCHNYGSKAVDRIWSKIMNWLQGNQAKAKVKKKRN